MHCFAVVVPAIALLLVSCATLEGPRKDELEEAAMRGQRYLIRNVKDDGMFVYRVNMDPDVEVTPKYNILRHAGTLYALCQYLGFSGDDHGLAELRRAGAYLRDEAIGVVEGQPGLLAVWSKPEVNNTGDPLQAKLGGNGLGLVALLSLEKIEPGFTALESLQALGRFVVFMQKDDGSFYSKYVPSEGGRSDSFVSLYYPGEAALGLVMLYERDGNELWLNTAAKALRYLALIRAGSAEVPADHWALLATSRLMAVDASEELPVSRELLKSHAIQICESILATQVESCDPVYDGGFSYDGGTTPTATRLEGLLAARTFLPPDSELSARIDAAAARGILFLLRAQVRGGGFDGALPRATGQLHRTAPDAEALNRRATEVRIDYIQHAISAMIQYRELLDAGG